MSSRIAISWIQIPDRIGINFKKLESEISRAQKQREDALSRIQIPDIFDSSDELGFQKLLKTHSDIKNLRKETQETDKKISVFTQYLLDSVGLVVIGDDEKSCQGTSFKSDPSSIIDRCHSISDSNVLSIEHLCSILLEIHNNNRKLLTCLTKLETSLQAVIVMWLVTSVKQIPSFAVYLICNFNMNIIEWLRSGLGEEMLGDLTERHHEIKEEHQNSDILVSFLLLGTVIQMLWSVLLIKLDDLMSDEKIAFYFVGMQSSLA